MGNDSGGVGRAAKRKARGWRKGWAKDYRKLTGAQNIPQVGSYGSIKDKK